MKKFGSILLTFAVLFILCAGTLPVYAATTITISANRTVLVVGQEASITVNFSTAEPLTYILTSSDESIVAINDDYPGMVYAVSKGTAVITAQAIDPDTNRAISASVTIKVRTPTGLLDNTDYYIMNCGTGKLLSLESATDANSVRLIGKARSNDMISRWTLNIEEDSFGYHTGRTQLISANSAAGRKAYVSGTNLILYNITSERTKFAIHRIESGTNQGRYAIRYGTQYVAMNSSGTVYLTSSSSNNIYWCFMAVEKGYADIYSHQYTGYDTTANNSDFYFTFQELGYSAYISVNEAAEYAYEYLPDDHVFVFRGHANAGLLGFRDSNGNLSGRFYADTKMPFSNGYFICNSLTNTAKSYLSDNALANLRCALLLGCKTGVDYLYGANTYNLVNAYFVKGAHLVVGTTYEVAPDNSDAFLAGFLDKLSSGSYNLYDCLQAGLRNAGINDSYVSDDNPYGYYPIVTVGDSSQFLN